MGSKVISAIVAEFLNPISDGTKGRMLTDWQFINGKWYYFNESSLMVADQATPDGYYVDADGVWIQ